MRIHSANNAIEYFVSNMYNFISMLMLLLNFTCIGIVAPLPVRDVTAAFAKGCHVLFSRSARSLSLSLSTPSLFGFVVVSQFATRSHFKIN